MKNLHLIKTFLVIMTCHFYQVSKAIDIASDVNYPLTVPLSITFDCNDNYHIVANLNKSMFATGPGSITPNGWIRGGYPGSSGFNSTPGGYDGVTFELYKDNVLQSSHLVVIAQTTQDFTHEFVVPAQSGDWKVMSKFSQLRTCGGFTCSYYYYANKSGIFITPPHANGSGVTFCTAATAVNDYGTGQGFSSNNQFPRFLADVNGDGKNDVIAIAYSGVSVSLSNSTSGSTNFSAPSLWLANQYGVSQSWVSQEAYPRMMADVNGDGKADIVGFANDGAYVSLSTGSSFSTPSFWLLSFGYSNGWISNLATPRFLTDVNNDGKSDIVGFGTAGVYVSLSTGSSFGPQTLWLANNFCINSGYANVNSYPRIMEDINGDGIKDIVGFANTGVYVSLGTGSSFASPSFWSTSWGQNEGYTGQNLYPRLLRDIDGDNRPDIVGFAQSGTYYSKNTGSSFLPKVLLTTSFAISSWPAFPNDSETPRFLAKINNDAFPDIIGFGPCGIVIALNNGNGTFGMSQRINTSSFDKGQGWLSQNTHPRFVINIDDDIRDEIIGFSNSGVSISNGTCNGGTAFRKSDLNDISSNTSDVYMGQNYPNPFHDNTTIDYKITRIYDNAEIVGYDILGNEIFIKHLTNSEGKLEITKGDFGANKMIIFVLIIDKIKYKSMIALAN